MSSSASTFSPVPKAPFLAASAVFLVVAILIGAFAIAPLGAAELLGIAACAAAAAVFASVPFVVDFTRRLDASRAPSAPAPSTAPAAPAPMIDPARLAEQIAAAVDSRLAASEDRRRDELVRAATAAASTVAASGAGSRPPLEADQIPAPAAGARPRLGRGLASLIHNPSALAKPAAEPDKAPAPDDADDHRAAA